MPLIELELADAYFKYSSINGSKGSIGFILKSIVHSSSVNGTQLSKNNLLPELCNMSIIIELLVFNRFTNNGPTSIKSGYHIATVARLESIILPSSETVTGYKDSCSWLFNLKCSNIITIFSFEEFKQFVSNVDCHSIGGLECFRSNENRV
eukprot:NODE_6_length_48303_cov_0.387022.p19 type:complete len:151 gc:universal NODE_6_length_48303_cov_0.387022:44883-45335(+)